MVFPTNKGFQMEGFELWKQGAEAKLYKGRYLGKPVLIKERFEKKYRHPELDVLLTKERIKAESRATMRCKSVGICTPTIYLVDLRRRSIYMEYFEYNITVKEFIKQATTELIEKLSCDIGVMLGKMHSNNIIHGDLTTSNMLVINNSDDLTNYTEDALVLIDFGLARIDSTAEDKAVDLYVLERALISTHENPKKIFEDILQSYKKQYKKGHSEVFAKLEDVRTRGRKRIMIG